MVGDVNIFLRGLHGDEDFEAEVEIMIAGRHHVINLWLLSHELQRKPIGGEG
jgi:hypothetical protein